MSDYGFPKPIKGTFLLERKQRRSEIVKREQQIMSQAKKRDGNVCRFPMCRHKSLRIETAHFHHRGIGGDPSGDRTQLPILVTLCVAHHGQYDACLIDVQPQDSALGANGPLDFFVRTESGRFELFASEKRIGVSTVKGV